MSFLDPSLPGGQAQELEDPNLALAAQESGFIAPDVEADQDAIAQQVFTNLAGRVAGWQANDGNLDTWLVESFSEIGAEIRSLAADVPASIFATYGTLVLGIPPQQAVSAAGQATVTAVDNQGYTLDTGTTFALARSGNDLVAFRTLQAATIAPGDTSVGGVEFVAVEQGADANGLSGAGQMLDAVAWVTAISVAAPTVDGLDAETPEAYVNRLANLFPAIALRPILPQDFAVLALQVPGVGRAIAMNLYDPATNTWTNARTVTLILTQADGTPCTAAVKQQVAAMLEDLREVNWVLHIVDPVYTPINVVFTATAYAGQDQTTVHDAAIANVQAALGPGNFRLGVLSPAIAGGEVILPPTSGQPARRQVIHLNDIVALVDRSLGVDFVNANTVTLNGSAVDYTLAQPYSLPTPGTITATILGANP